MLVNPHLQQRSLLLKISNKSYNKSSNLFKIISRRIHRILSLHNNQLQASLRLTWSDLLPCRIFTTMFNKLITWFNNELGSNNNNKDDHSNNNSVNKTNKANNVSNEAVVVSAVVGVVMAEVVVIFNKMIDEITQMVHKVEVAIEMTSDVSSIALISAITTNCLEGKQKIAVHLVLG